MEQVKRRYTRIKFRHPAAEKRSDDEPILLTSTASTPSATSSPLVKSEGDEPPRKMQKTFHTSPPAPTAEVPRPLSLLLLHFYPQRRLLFPFL